MGAAHSRAINPPNRPMAVLNGLPGQGRDETLTLARFRRFYPPHRSPLLEEGHTELAHWHAANLSILLIAGLERTP
jgi:hypothetical protein